MRKRALTILAVLPVVLGILFTASPWPVIIAAALVMALGYGEVVRLVGADARVPWLGSLALCAVAALHLLGGLVRWLPPILYAGVAFFAIGTATLSTLLLRKNLQSWAHPVWRAELASLWLLGPLISLLAIHQLDVGETPYRFQTPILMVLVPVWVGDILAYLVGKSIGKRQLMPGISPKKTVEGAVANIIGSIGAAALLGPLIALPMDLSLMCGACAGILGQVGDLFESGIKRHAGIKDSGQLLPGHGGVLDRLDSILFTTPATVLLIFLHPR